MISRKSVTIHYRRLNDVTNSLNGKTLEQCLKESLKFKIGGEEISEHWKHRAWLVPPDNTDTYLMNVFQEDSNSFFGDLTNYTKGFLQTLIQNNNDVPVLAVEQLPPPQGKEYVHSMMFWMVVGNHVFVMNSKSLSSKHLEEYFTWILKDHTSKIKKTGHIILDAKFDEGQVGGELNDISEIIVGGSGLSNDDFREVTETEVIKHTDIEEKKPWGERAIDVLKAVMNSEADVQNLLKEIPEGAKLDVSVHIGFKSRKKKISRAPMSQALRNLPEGEITARGKDGKIKGKDIRLSFPVNVLMNGSLIDVNDAKLKFNQAYEYFVTNGKIEP